MGFSFGVRRTSPSGLGAPTEARGEACPCAICFRGTFLFPLRRGIPGFAAYGEISASFSSRRASSLLRRMERPCIRCDGRSRRERAERKARRFSRTRSLSLHSLGSRFPRDVRRVLCRHQKSKSKAFCPRQKICWIRSSGMSPRRARGAAATETRFRQPTATWCQFLPYRSCGHRCHPREILSCRCLPRFWIRRHLQFSRA